MLAACPVEAAQPWAGLNYYPRGSNGWAQQWLHYPALQSQIDADFALLAANGSVSFVRTFLQDAVVQMPPSLPCNATTLGNLQQYVRLRVVLGFDGISVTNVTQAEAFLACVIPFVLAADGVDSRLSTHGSC